MSQSLLVLLSLMPVMSAWDQCRTASVCDEYRTADNSSLYHTVCIFMSGDVNAKYFPNWLHMLLLNTKKMAQTA